MAPEMLAMLHMGGEDDNGYTNMVDYWSLGVMMFKLLTNQLPFQGTHMAFFANYLAVKACDVAPKESYGSPERDYISEYVVFLQAVMRSCKVPQGSVQFLWDLLQLDYTKRLGYGRHGVRAIKNHTYFQTIDWDLLGQKLLVPPPIAPNGVRPKKFDNNNLMSFESFNDMLCESNRSTWLTSFPSSFEQQYFDAWLVNSCHEVV